MSKREEQAAKIKALAASVLGPVNGSTAASIARNHTSGTTTRPDDVACIWAGEYFALIYESGTSYWSGMGSTGYAPSEVELVVRSKSRAFGHGSGVPQRARELLAERSGIEQQRILDFWKGASGKRLDAATLTKLRDDAAKLDKLYPAVLARIEEEDLQEEQKQEEAEEAKAAEKRTIKARLDAVVARLRVQGVETAAVYGDNNLMLSPETAEELAEYLASRGLVVK